MRENRRDLGAREDQRQPSRTLGAGDLHQIQITAEDVLVRKEQRRERLALSRFATGTDEAGASRWNRRLHS